MLISLSVISLSGARPWHGRRELAATKLRMVVRLTTEIVPTEVKLGTGVALQVVPCDLAFQPGVTHEKVKCWQTM